MLKGDLLEPQSWLRCPSTCAGQDVTPNSKLVGANLILYLEGRQTAEVTVEATGVQAEPKVFMVITMVMPPLT